MNTTDATSSRPRVASPGWWFRSADGRLVLGQFPNPAIGVWVATVVLRLFDLSAAHEADVRGVGRGALIVWGLDELVRGATPFRRVLGAVVLVFQVLAIAH